MKSEPHEPTPADLSHAIGQLHALGAAVHRELLEFVAAYDDIEAWAADGVSSMASWLTAQLGLAYETACEWVRVAHAVVDLPAIATVYSQGAISWDQLRALTRMATPEADTQLADMAPGTSAAYLRRLARRANPPTAEEDEDAYQRRTLHLREDERRNVWRLWGRLPAADGAVLAKALERIVGRTPIDPDTGVFEPLDKRQADALIEMASTRLAAESDADRATVVIHVDAEVLGGAEGAGEIENGPVIAGETARRLACDATWQIVTHGAGGLPMGIGRRSRQVPAPMSRELRQRDWGCRFPGCGSTRWVAAHHLVHWAQGGPTDMDNLVLLCGRHHRLVHEGGWRISGSPDGQLLFIRPDGEVLTPGPPKLLPEIRERFFGPEEESRTGPAPP